MNNRKLRHLALGVFGAQLTFSLVISPLIGSKDFFPFFRWSLFAVIRPEQEVAVITIHRVNSQRFIPPSHHFSLFKDQDHKFDFTRVQDQLHEAISLNSSKDPILGMTQVIENLFGSQAEVEFEVQRARVDILEFMKLGKIREAETLYGPYIFSNGLIREI